MRLSFGHRLGGLLAVLLEPLSTSAAHADAIFVIGSGMVGEYTTSGATVNASLIPSVPGVPLGIAVSGSDLFIASYEFGVNEYTTSGAAVSVPLTGLPSVAHGLAISGADLFVSSFFAPACLNPSCGVIGEYTTSGAVVDEGLITTGLDQPWGIAVVGSDLFVVNYYRHDRG